MAVAPDSKESRTRRRTATTGLGFVVFACAKSGTTWVQRFLSAHPSIHCGESRLFGKYFRYEPSRYSAPHISVEGYAGLLLKYLSAPASGDDRAVFSDDLLRGLIDAIADTCRGASGKPIYGEKFTPFADTEREAAARLLEYRPGMPIVHLVRDGRDVAVSGFAQQAGNRLRSKHGGWDEDATRRALLDRRIPDDQFDLWTRMWRQSVEAGLTLEQHGAMRVRYEDMLADPEREFSRILGHLGADTATEVMSSCIEAASFEKLSGGRARGQCDNTSFFRSGSSGDWRTWLTPEQSGRFEAEAGELLRLLGYCES